MLIFHFHEAPANRENRNALRQQVSEFVKQFCFLSPKNEPTQQNVAIGLAAVDLYFVRQNCCCMHVRKKGDKCRKWHSENFERTLSGAKLLLGLFVRLAGKERICSARSPKGNGYIAESYLKP